MHFVPSEFVIIIVLLAMSAVLAYPSMRICRRVGLPPALGLLVLVPFANLALLWFVALAPWPVAGTSLLGGLRRSFARYSGPRP